MIRTIRIIQEARMIQISLLIWMTENTHRNENVTLKKGIS